MAIKITEMTEATQVNNNDLFMIVQNGENKKITKENLQGSIVDTELEERVDTLEDEVEALQEENLYLNNLVEQAFDKKEVEGEELSIDDTINAKMEVGLLGNTKQETTETSPSPDYPSNVNVVTGDNTIVVSNKNLFDKNNLTNNYRLDSNGQPYADNGYALTDYIKVQSNTQYTRNIDFAWNVPICLYDINKNFISRIQTGKTITTTNDTYYVRTDVAIADIDIAQLEINSTATPYTPHQEQTFQINLGTIELCGIGDYRDYFYKSNNKWYKHSEIGKVVLDGTETWNYTIPNKFTLLQDINMKAFNINTTGYLFCDYYTERANADADNYDYAICKYGTSASYNYNKIVIKDKDCTTATQLNNKLSTHNTSVYYVLATPTNTEITDTTLISQLEALKTAMSYAEQTNISQINNDTPFILQVTALASYNSRILALENAILNANRSTPVENTRKSNELIEEPKEEVEESKEENKEER